MKKPIVFFDTEVGVSDEKIHDIGAVSENGSTLHSSSVSDFLSFINKDAILCGNFYISQRKPDFICQVKSVFHLLVIRRKNG